MAEWVGRTTTRAKQVDESFKETHIGNYSVHDEEWETVIKQIGNFAGVVIVEPAVDELFIDLDNPHDIDWLYEACDILTANGQTATVERLDESFTPDHFHAVVKLHNAKLTPTARVGFQAAMGSDRKRELLSLLRIGFKVRRPATVFFEKDTDGN